jgi:hypothetical protein
MGTVPFGQFGGQGVKLSLFILRKIIDVDLNNYRLAIWLIKNKNGTNE